MPRLGSSVKWALVFGLGLAVGGESSRAASQASPSPAPARPKKSVYEELQSVEKRLSALVMVADDGQRLVWKFEKDLITEAEQFKPGDAMIVIYRRARSLDQAGGRGRLPRHRHDSHLREPDERTGGARSAPLVDGACGLSSEGPVHE